MKHTYRFLLIVLFFLPLVNHGQTKLPNPIVAGFYPDPAICKVGPDYYLVNSTFVYFPGIPVLHSKDLKNWEQIGSVIDRPSQMDFMGERVSRGLFAPAINYHNGTFYVTCTDIDHGGNFVVTAKNPAGPWSDPVWLKEVRGIDPSLFFDGDKAYIIYNSDPPENKSLYSGHRTLKIFEFDPLNLKVKGEETLLVNGGVDISKKPVWIEGPHIYKRNDWYYLMAAEGGTAVNHSEVIFRSKNVRGPFVPYENNPILTQRHLDPNRKNPITSTGHADLVEGPDGKTYAVFIAVRPYESDFYNTGRETFIAPVEWKNDWPVINPDREEVQYSYNVPWKEVKLKQALPVNGNFSYTEDFNGKILGKDFLFLRTHNPSWYHLQNGYLALNLLPETASEPGNPAFIGKRQQHLTCQASTELNFNAAAGNEKAGLLIFQGENNFYYICKSRSGANDVVQVYQSKPAGGMELLKEEKLPAGNANVWLKISAERSTYSFYYATTRDKWMPLLQNADGKFLSTRVAGGFVGSLFAMYATAEGKPSQNKAAFNWFSYAGNDDVYKK